MEVMMFGMIADVLVALLGLGAFVALGIVVGRLYVVPGQDDLTVDRRDR